MAARSPRVEFKEIDVPDPLIEGILREECVVFLGAGASTEGKGTSYWKQLLIDELAAECDYPSSLPRRLPDVAEYYCEKLDASRKGRLVRLIRSRIDRFMRHGDAYRSVTICHNIIASIPYFKVIVTTNWDPFMERVANLIQIVRDADMAYWTDASRQIIKMHGCITDPSSMVITRSDYKRYLDEKLSSVVVNKIRDLMSTKTFLFLGYGLGDPSFETIHSDILRRIGDFGRVSYAVIPDIRENLARAWRERGIVAVNALAYPFLEKLRGLLVDRGAMFDVENDMQIVWESLQKIADLHLETSAKQDSNVGMLSSMYQDGLQHELDALDYGLRLGITREQLEKELRYHEKSLADYRESDCKFRDVEIAYWTGRVRCIEWFLSEDRGRLLSFFSAKLMEPINGQQFKQELDEEIGDD